MLALIAVDAAAQSSPFAPVPVSATEEVLDAAEPERDGEAGDAEDDPEDSPKPTATDSADFDDSTSPDVWGSGAIEDPQNGWGSGAIEDPQNGWGSGAIEDPQNDSSGNTEDPQNSHAPPPTPTRVSSGGGGRPSAIFSGAFRSAAAVDTVRDDAFEDTIELLQELEMRIRYRLSDRWRFVLEGRLSWLMTGASAEGTTTLIPEAESVQGRVEPQLRDFYVAGRAGNWLIRIGNQSIVWGSTDFSKPADIINPLDLRNGFSGARDDMRVPIPALDFTRVWDAVTWEFVVLPFFSPHQVSVFGGDIAPIRPSGITLGLVPGAEGLVLIDPSLEDLAQPLLLQTELPEETPRNASVGSRLTLIRGGWDVSAGYLYGWDRTPFAEFSPTAIALFGAVLGGGADLTVDAPEVQAVLQALADGQALYSATYERMHTVEVDGVTYVGPIGVRFEATVSPERTLTLETLESVRRPTLTSALGLSYESSDGELVLAGEVFHNHAFLRGDDADGLFGLDDLLGVGAGTQLGLARYEQLDDSFARRLSFQLGGFYLPSGRDLILNATIVCELRSTLELSVGTTVFESFGTQDSLGDLVDRGDSTFVKIERVF